MGKTTGIQWTDATWNPHIGCRKVSAGCKHCYADREMKRYGKDFGHVRRTADATFFAPLRWKEPKRIFTCSWSDFFIEEADAWRGDAWGIIRRTPHHTYQILTKRPERIAACLPPDWGNGYPNVWLLVSVENQATADLRIPLLLAVPAAVHGVSCEPLLERVTVERWLHELTWVITGGESGPGCRPAHLDWFRTLRNECQAAGVPFFLKQLGGRSKMDGAWGGHRLDGEVWQLFPA